MRDDLLKVFLATADRAGLVLPDGVTIVVGDNGAISAGFQLCEFYYFRHPTLKRGMQPAQGGIIADAATKWPQAWAYLQTAEGQLLCKTEAQWQALSTAILHTNADGTTVGWNGIGGAPWYVQDLNAGTLRMWTVSFALAEHKSVPERAEERGATPAVTAQQNSGGKVDATAAPEGSTAPATEDEQLDIVQRGLKKLNDWWG